MLSHPAHQKSRAGPWGAARLICLPGKSVLLQAEDLRVRIRRNFSLGIPGSAETTLFPRAPTGWSAASEHAVPASSGHNAGSVRPTGTVRKALCGRDPPPVFKSVTWNHAIGTEMSVEQSLSSY